MNIKAMVAAIVLVAVVGLAASTAEAAASPRTYAILMSCAGWKLNRLPEIKQFINQEAGNYPDLSVNYYGGDPRIKFVVSEDGSPLNINPYSHYTDSQKGIGTEHIVNISNMNKQQVIDLLKQRGVRHKDDITAEAAAAPAPATIELPKEL